MDFSIVFENTKDRIPFVAETNSDILTYFVENLNRLESNKFLNRKKILRKPDSLAKQVTEANQYLVEYINKSLPVSYEFDQNYLNELHNLWVQYQVTEQVDVRATGLLNHYDDDNLYPYLNDVLVKIERSKHFDEINQMIHVLERQFDVVKYETSQWVDIVNPFPKDRCTNDMSNFNIAFNHLGRSLIEKWMNRDSNHEYADENTFNSLHGYLEINLARTYKSPLPIEYVDWCEKKGFVPSGHQLCIGNIPDLENRLTYYRNLLYNNIQSGNSFTIEY